jgi:hypothetical protein
MSQVFVNEYTARVNFSAQSEQLWFLSMSPKLCHRKLKRQTEKWMRVADKKCACQAEKWTSVNPCHRRQHQTHAQLASTEVHVKVVLFAVELQDLPQPKASQIMPATSFKAL